MNMKNNEDQWNWHLWFLNSVWLQLKFCSVSKSSLSKSSTLRNPSPRMFNLSSVALCRKIHFLIHPSKKEIHFNLKKTNFTVSLNRHLQKSSKHVFYLCLLPPRPWGPRRSFSLSFTLPLPPLHPSKNHKTKLWEAFNEKNADSIPFGGLS